MCPEERGHGEKEERRETRYEGADDSRSLQNDIFLLYTSEFGAYCTEDDIVLCRVVEFHSRHIPLNNRGHLVHVSQELRQNAAVSEKPETGCRVC